jgi:hypothetical protein
MFAGGGEEAVDEGEIIFALLGFGDFPRDRGEDGVEVEVNQPGPNGLEIVQTGGAGIVEFAGEDEVGLAVDNELGDLAVFFQMREEGGVGGRGGGREGNSQAEAQRNKQGVFHGG